MGHFTQLGTHGMFLVSFQGKGKRGGILLGDNAGITHHVDDVRHQIAVERGVLLPAGLVNGGGHFGQFENGTPKAFVAVFPTGGDILSEVARILQ